MVAHFLFGLKCALSVLSCLLKVFVELEVDEDAASSARVCFLSFVVAASEALLGLWMET